MMRSLSLLAVLALVSCAFVSAHLCLFDPPQRGALQLDVPGSDSCLHVDSTPCGGVETPGPVVATLVSGNIWTIGVQQNLNHWHDGQYGSFEVSLAPVSKPQESDFKQLSSSSDFNTYDEVTVTNFTIYFDVPKQPAFSAGVLRVQYRSKGTSDSTVFTQCADVQLITQETEAEEEMVATLPRARRLPFGLPSNLFDLGTAPSAAASNDEGCCLAPQVEFQTVGVQNGNEVASDYSYDAKNQLRYRMQYFAGIDAYGYQIGHYTNFTAGVEFEARHTFNGTICTPYGTDPYAPFCFGPREAQIWRDNITIGAQQLRLYTHSSRMEAWAVAPSEDEASICIPVIQLSADRNPDMHTFYNVTEGIRNPAIFTPEPACHKTEAYKMMQSHDLEAVRAFTATLPRRPAAQHHKTHKSIHHGGQPKHHHEAEHKHEHKPAHPSHKKHH